MISEKIVFHLEQKMEFEKFNCFFVDFLRYSFGRIKVISTVSSQVLYQIGLLFTLILRLHKFQYKFCIGQELERFQWWHVATRYDMIQHIMLIWTLHRHENHDGR